MSKKGKNIIIKASKGPKKGSPTARISAVVNKKGKLKGKAKKTLKHSCTGHIINERGKLRSKLKVKDGICECKICGQKFSTTLPSAEKIDKKYESNRAFYHRALFMGQAIGIGNDTLNFIADANDRDAKAYKAIKKIAKIVDKTEKLKKKKHINKDDFVGGTESYGSWS